MSNVYNIEEKHLIKCGELFVKAFNANPWNDNWTVDNAYKRLKDIYSTPNFIGLVYIENDEVKGAVLGNCETWYDGTDYNLKEIFIDVDHKGRGIGSTIIEELESKLNTLNINKIILNTLRAKEVSNFYIKNEYKELEDVVTMSKYIK
ncbi:acetyltransferase, GNAT family [Gottschalkia acidurici 9a]|uniref:Acetyltransferase, GNAT family n=1 Tax=Gottschalkia acidurici (strain ATCC 7906 / DSM 604 / BCRC 14475 / CIP 104303 / KCTC 5404 / NCIMB 10678 / 9a) TaxID=1128398 RepID=K0AZG7_GOTA9|nr:GNAT family N-acetyltransferase [Gottschalkia acidurici]AFS77766.1 acetyltransferase, GNAT family [Gottschalkia acidurici 9a]